MKTALLILAALSASSFADVPLPRDEATTFKTLDVQQIEEQAVTLRDKIVRVRFSSRDRIAEPTPDGGLRGSINIYVTKRANSINSNQRNGSMFVIVPKEGSAWFLKQPTEFAGKSIQLVFARISMDGARAKAELLGREIKTDLKGSVIVW